MEILIKASQLILSLSILIILHELGHFIPAKLFKTKVDKFYLFFDPWFSLFKIKKGETEYGIGWLPLGGYVKIAGMIDESMDKEQMKLPPQPWEFRSKPAWQRLIIMIGGVTVNLLLGMFIYSMVLFAYGEEYLSSKNMKYGIACDSIAVEAGLKDGDKILAVDGVETDNFSKIASNIVINDAKELKIERDGNISTIELPKGTVKKLIEKQGEFIAPRFPFVIGDFAKNSEGEKAGLKVGDKLLAINDIPTPYFSDFKKTLQNFKNKEIDVKVLRNNSEISIKTKVPAEGRLGISPADLEKFLVISKKKYTFFESIPAGSAKAFTVMYDYIKQFKLIFNSEVKGYESLGGFITFGKVFSPEWDWFKFWNITAFFSIVLAFMNILPIPALDGGHVIFLLYEIITKRKPNEKAMEYAQTAGMILLFSLLIFANGNDIFRLFK